jgi:hypothetical protein
VTNKKNANDYRLIGALIAGGVLAGGAVLFFSRTGSPGITATGGSKVATGNSRIEEHITTNEYDLAEKRRRDIARFAKSVGRECRPFEDLVRTLSVTDQPTGEIPNLIGYVFLTPDIQELLGAQTYDTLVSRNSKLQQLHGELVQLQIRNMVRPQPSAEFEPKREELGRLSREYCELVASLKP